MQMFSLKADFARKNKTLFEMSQNWINNAFRFRGYTHKGCDCCGLIIGVLYENDILDDDFIKKYKQIKFGTNLSKITNDVVLDNILLYFDRTDDILKSDLLLIQTKNSPIHFMIYEKGKKKNEARIIHTTKEIGRVFVANFE